MAFNCCYFNVIQFCNFYFWTHVKDILENGRFKERDLGLPCYNFQAHYEVLFPTLAYLMASSLNLPEDATPLGPIEITPGNIGPRPYFGLYMAGAGDLTITGTPGKDDFTGDLTVSALNGNVDPESDPLQETTPGSILFSLTGERSGTLSYDSKKREWVIVFSPELDTSMVESLNTTIMLALSVRSGESCEGTNCTSIDRKLGIPITQELSLGKTHTITFDVSNVAFETFTFEKEDPCPGDTFFSTEFGFCRCPFGQGLAIGTDDTCVPCPGLIDGNGFCLTI
jgi:hypothetical protein